MKKNVKNTTKTNMNMIFVVAFFLFSAACIVFGLLCLSESNVPFIVGHNILFSVLVPVIISILCGISVVLLIKGKDSLVRIVFSFYILLLFCLVFLYILQKTGFFTIVESSESLSKYLEETGIWMPILYIILQYLQVVILPIPSVVSTLAGVALFGAFKTVIYSLVGIILGSFTAFFIGRKLGYRAVVWIVGRDKLSLWRKKLKGKDNFFLTVMFLLPFFPDDILCFIAGLASMSFKYFAGVIAISRILIVSATCYSIDIIPYNTWWGLLIWSILIIGIVLAFFWIYKNMNRIQKFFNKCLKKRNRR